MNMAPTCAHLLMREKLTLENIEKLKYSKLYSVYPKCFIPNQDGFEFMAILSSGGARNDTCKCFVKEGDNGCFVQGADYSKIIGWFAGHTDAATGEK